MSTTAPGTSEFDRFGPWIDEVRAPSDVPRLFRDHPLDLAAARLVLKVPRSVARRAANADMDLYDHLLVLDDDALTVLSRDTAGDARPSRAPGTYRTQVLALADIAAVRDSVSLLNGTLRLLSRDGTEVVLAYNGSAREWITRLVSEVVRTLPGGRPRAVGLAILDPAHSYAAATADLTLPDDVALVSALRALEKDRPALVRLAWHGREVLRSGGAGLRSLAQRLPDALSPLTLQGAVLVTDSRTLEVIGRDEWLLRGVAPVYSTSHLVVALDAIDAVVLRAHPLYPRAIEVTLGLGAGSVDLVVPADSAAHRVLWQASQATTGR